VLGGRTKHSTGALNVAVTSPPAIAGWKITSTSVTLDDGFEQASIPDSSVDYLDPLVLALQLEL
jgi:hypothetical protein